jgi:serum/glucocorticoid-regulated kinase 3
MDYKERCPSVSLPSSDEHREKKKRFTVCKVLVSVGRSEWFVFRKVFFGTKPILPVFF